MIENVSGFTDFLKWVGGCITSKFFMSQVNHGIFFVNFIKHQWNLVVVVQFAELIYKRTDVQHRTSRSGFYVNNN
mgnify:CR=1 FL=1